MAYTDLVTFEASATPTSAGAVKIDDDYTLIVYFASGVINARVISNSGTAGAADTVSVAVSLTSEISVCQLTATLYVATWTDLTTVKAAPIDVLGATATFGTVATVEVTSSAAPTPQVCKLGSTKALVIYARLSGGTTYNIRAATLSGITGSSLTPNSPVTLASTTGSVVGSYLTPSACYADSNYAYVVWGDGSGTQYAGLVSSASTTPSLVDSDTFPSIVSHVPDNTTTALASVDTNKAICGWFEVFTGGSLQKLYAAVLTDNGSTITINTPVLIASWNPSAVTALAYLNEYSTSEVILWYPDTDMQALRIGISGTTPSLLSTVLEQIDIGDYATNSQALMAIGADTFGGIRQGSGIVFYYTPSGVLFYSGTNTLTSRAALAISDVQRGGMVIRNSGDAIVATADNTDTAVVLHGTAADSFATWTNITNSHPTGRVTSLQEV